jgi:hypothetical protein
MDVTGLRCPGCPDPLKCVQLFTCSRMSTSDPQRLRGLADRIESQHCTGVAARWCPVHGTCSCKRGERADLNDARCPLHASTSSHAEAELAEFDRESREA